MKRLRVIQIGLGHDHSGDVLDRLIARSDIFELVGFAVPECEEEPFAEKIKKFRDKVGVKKYSVEDILALKGVDGAFIETEEKNLCKYALMAARSGLHIHMDKPGGEDLTSFEDLVNTLKERHLTFSMGYMYRFNPQVQEAIDIIKSGKLGEVYSVEAHMNCEHTPQKREWLSRFSGGMMFFLGCHLIDLIYTLQGEPLEVLPLIHSTNADNVTALDFGFCAFKYPNGISFAKACANEAGGYIRRQLVICAEGGTIEINPLEFYEGSPYPDFMMHSEMRITKKGGGWTNIGKKVPSEEYSRYDRMLESFADIVLGKKQNPYSYDYELGLYKLILKSCNIKI